MNDRSGDEEEIGDFFRRVILRQVHQESSLSDFQESLQQDYGAVLGAITLDELYEKIRLSVENIDAAVEVLEEEEDIPPEELEVRRKAFITEALSGQFVEYLILSSVFIEYYSIEILRSGLIEQEYQDSSQTGRLLEKHMNQAMREDLLLRTGLIEADTKSDICEVRQLRDDIAHNLFDHVALSGVDDIMERLDFIYQAHNQMEKRAQAESESDGYFLE